MLNKHWTECVLKQIKNISSIEELDNYSTDFFYRWGTLGHDDIINAIGQRESELEFSYYNKEIKLMTSETSKVTSIDLVRKRPKKEKPVIAYHHASHVACNCENNNIACIHRIHLNEAGPNDYIECECCGVDHKYDFRLAEEVHSKVK